MRQDARGEALLGGGDGRWTCYFKNAMVEVLVPGASLTSVLSTRGCVVSILLVCSIAIPFRSIHFNF